MQQYGQAQEQGMERERLGLEKERTELARTTAEAEEEHRKRLLDQKVFSQAMEITKPRRDVPGVGKPYIHSEDVIKNLQMIKDLQAQAETGEDDLQTFIDNPAERDALKKTNPLIYNQFLEKAQAQGQLTDLETEVSPGEKPGVSLEKKPATKKLRLFPQTQQALQQLPSTTPAPQRVGKAIGAGAAETAGAVGKLPSQAVGLGASGYNVLADLVTGTTGIPQRTIPEPVLEMLRQGQLFDQPLQNIQTMGGALGEGVRGAGEYYKGLLQNIMQKYGIKQ